MINMIIDLRCHISRLEIIRTNEQKAAPLADLLIYEPHGNPFGVRGRHPNWINGLYWIGLDFGNPNPDQDWIGLKFCRITDWIKKF